jgi:hypothetical protein
MPSPSPVGKDGLPESAFRSARLARKSRKVLDRKTVLLARHDQQEPKESKVGERGCSWKGYRAPSRGGPRNDDEHDVRSHAISERRLVAGLTARESLDYSVCHVARERGARRDRPMESGTAERQYHPGQARESAGDEARPVRRSVSAEERIAVGHAVGSGFLIDR